MNGKQFAVSVVAVFVAATGLSKTVYLDLASKNPAAPYSSWETAASDPATAFAAANVGYDEIRVAPGTYAVTDELHMSAGSVTVRSCDKTTGLPDAENTVFDGSGLASGSILRPNNNVKLYDLTFRNGKAAEEGGALYFKDWLGATRIENCRFENNAATLRGGAIYFHVGNHGTVVTNCTFVGNAVTATTAEYQGGGAIFNNSSTDTPYVLIVDCVASNNTASGVSPCGGCLSFANPTVVRGGYYLNNSNATVTSGKARGGCIRANEGCVFSGVVFEGICKATYGGVIDAGANTIVSNCVFKNLTGSVNYGIVHPNVNAEIVDCQVLNSQIGTAFCFQEWSTGRRLRNCLVADGNTGLFIGFQGSGRIEHCTFVGNSVVPLSSNTSGQTVILNSLLDFTGLTQGAADGTHVYVISNSYLSSEVSGAVVSGNIVGGATGVKVDANGAYLLRADSPLIDKGLALDWTADGHDLYAQPRTVGSAPDCGCSEWKGGDSDVQRVVARAEDRVGEWADAFVGAQNGIDGALSGYDLVFKAGTYALDAELTVSDKTFALKAETDGAVTFDAQGLGRCLCICAQKSGRPVSIRGVNFINGRTKDGDEGQRYGRGAGVYATSATPSSRITLSHCQISNCLAECATMPAGYNRGGGLFAANYVTLEDSLIADCCASNAVGGGAFVTATSSSTALGAGPIVRRTVFSGNRTFSTTGVGETANGGGVYSENKVLFEDCRFTDNQTPKDGGGVYLGNSARITGSFFNGNSANACGAIGYAGGDAIVSNCVIVGTKKGSNFYAYQVPPLVTHCVFSNNLVDCHLAIGYSQTFRNCLFNEPLACSMNLNQGAGTCTLENCTFVNCKKAISIWGYGGSAPRAVVKNCLFANNTADFTRETVCTSDPSCIFTNCCFAAYPSFTQYTATGTVLSAAPRFVDAAHGDYRLKPGSPCRDKGLLLNWMDAASLDLDGAPRVVASGIPLAQDPSAKPDIGCYECQLAPRGCILLFR